MGSGFGILVFAALLVLLIACSISVTQTVVSDTDPSTYVIVPMLMLPVFAIFMIKKSGTLRPKVQRSSMLLGILLFLLFIIVGLYLHSYLGPIFLSYRIDMLLIPIAIASLALLIFGKANLRHFIWIGIYALFASPLLFLPVINANLGFASLNTIAVYYPIKIFFPAVTYSAPISLYLNTQAISIGNSCIGIGALIAIVMFMLPVAYFLEGKTKRKAMWVAGGLILLIVLNYLRMLLITLGWFFYGPNQNILDIHSFIGQLIFYAVIIAMMLLVGKFGLSYPKLKPDKTKSQYNNAALGCATVLSLVYFLISLSYLSAYVISVTSLGVAPSFTYSGGQQMYNEYVSYSGSSYSFLSNNSDSIAMYLENATGPGGTAVVLFAVQNATIENKVLGSNSITGWKAYESSGNIGYLYKVSSPNSFLYYEKVPYTNGAATYIVDMYLFMPYAGASLGSGCISSYDRGYDLMLNIAQLDPDAFNSTMDSAYCQVKKLIR